MQENTQEEVQRIYTLFAGISIPPEVKRAYFETGKIISPPPSQDASSPLQSALSLQRNLHTPNLLLRAEEIPETNGARSFFICSHRQFYERIKNRQPRHARNFHEIVQEGCPVNGFIDLDMYGEFVDDDSAVDAAMECIAESIDMLVIELEGKDGWDFDALSDIRINTAISDSDHKKSRHVVIHFPGNRMFKSVVDAYYFFSDVLAVSLVRFDNDMDECPLFYMHNQTRKCMLDMSVYTLNHNFRALGCCKPGGPDKPFMLPKCNHADGTCGGDQCPYTKGIEHVPESLFMANSVMFVPLDRASGVPVKGRELTWRPTYCKTAIEKYNRTHGIRLTAAANLPHSDTFTAWCQMTRELVQRTLGTMHPCKITRVHDSRTIIISALRYRVCPYGRAGGVHQNNHVYFLASMDFPQPRVTIKCHDPECATAFADKMTSVLAFPATEQQLIGTIQEVTEKILYAFEF